MRINNQKIDNQTTDNQPPIDKIQTNPWDH
jgi:hypothetical protein